MVMNHRDVNPGTAQHRDQIAISQRIDGLERLAVHGGAGDHIAVDHHSVDRLAIDVGDEFAVGEGRGNPLWLIEKIEEQDHGETNHQPHAEIFIESVQRVLQWPPDILWWYKR
jgi:hypothetical protein